MKLYSYWRSSSAWRVRIALHYKGITFEYVPVNIVKDGGEQFRDAYRAINGMAQVPTLEFEEGGATRRIGQSLAIIELLEERYPSPPLLPASSYLRARARQLAEIINSGIQPFQNLYVTNLVEREYGASRQAFAAQFIDQGLAAFQAIVEETGGRFSVGDAPTIADVCLVPQLAAARRMGADMSKIGRLLRIEEQCARLPAFEAAHSTRQTDAVPA
jgi:maleylpyruvate isomerase